MTMEKRQELCRVNRRNYVKLLTRFTWSITYMLCASAYTRHTKCHCILSCSRIYSAKPTLIVRATKRPVTIDIKNVVYLIFKTIFSSIHGFNERSLLPLSTDHWACCSMLLAIEIEMRGEKIEYKSGHEPPPKQAIKWMEKKKPRQHSVQSSSFYGT